MTRRIDMRTLFPQIGTAAAALLLPLWLRIEPLSGLAPLYSARFLLFLVMLAAVMVWLLAGLPGFAALRRAEGRRGRWRRGWALCLLALALWAGMSTQWAFAREFDPDVSLTNAVQFAVVALFAVMVACCAPPRWVLAAFIAFGAAWTAPIVIAQALNGGWLGLTALGEFPIRADDSHVSILRAGDQVFLRPYGLMPHPNVAAGALMVGMLAASALLFAAQRWIRMGGAALLVLGLAALLLTFSRGAWVGLAAGGLIGLLLLLRRLKHPNLRLPLALALAGGLIVGVVWAAAYRPFVLARAGEGQESVELRSVADRIVFTDFALRSIQERPILGIGIGNFPWRSSYYIRETFYRLRGDNVHHVYLLAWAELGTPGILLLLAALICAIGAALSQPITPARGALLAATGALAVVGLVDHYPWTLLPMQTAWWLCLAGALAEDGVRRVPHPA